MPTDIIEVTALRHQRRRASDVIWHESYVLTERELTEVSNIPVTKPGRTFIDLGVVLTSSQLEEVLDEGLRRNLLDTTAIRRELDRLGPRRPGAYRVRKTLASQVASNPPADSVLETRFRQLLRRAAIRMPTPQFEVRANGFIARVDFAYPELKLAVELDGAAYHSSPRAQRRDRNRENQLVAMGWRVLRFTWEDLRDRPGVVIDAMRCVQGAR